MTWHDFGYQSMPFLGIRGQLRRYVGNLPLTLRTTWRKTGGIQKQLQKLLVMSGKLELH